MSDMPNDSTYKADSGVCKAMYKTLLKCSCYNLLHDSVHLDEASAHVVDIFETAQCDHIKDLSALRSGLAYRLNRDDGKRTKRILGFRDDFYDQKACMHILTYYRDVHKSAFRSALWTARRAQVKDACKWLQGK